MLLFEVRAGLPKSTAISKESRLGGSGGCKTYCSVRIYFLSGRGGGGVPLFAKFLVRGQSLPTLTHPPAMPHPF